MFGSYGPINEKEIYKFIDLSEIEIVGGKIQYMYTRTCKSSIYMLLTI